MKKISLVGLILGATLGVIAGLMAGGWLFWLGAGLALGVVIGAAQERGGRGGRIQRGKMGAGDLHL
jgi:uncharacterized membrane protein YoaK (UPF0700 family)